MSELPQILDAIAAGDPDAASQLLPLVYDELRKLAAQKLAGEKPGQTLQPTALVHEAYLRLVGDGAGPHWNGRRKRCPKHGGGGHRVALDEALPAPPDDADGLLALDEALSLLAAEDPEA